MKKTHKIGVIGLGYVGLPLSVVFSKKYKVVGFDIKEERINQLKLFDDITNEIDTEELRDKLDKNLVVTSKVSDLRDCNIFIVTVPTPVTSEKKPDLSFLLKATEMVSKMIKKEDIIIFESTVYPGCTEEECVPILEKNSKLVYNKDFFCGYSPERINPGDKINTIDKIVKVTSGSNAKSAQIIDNLYSSIISAGTFKASSIKVAEASKSIENAQRDLNISFVNELAIIFDLMKIDTSEVIEAASTKWNFLKFTPGLVGGHCISVDPYYLAYKSELLGYKPKVISSGREVNERMSHIISDQIFDMMVEREISIDKSDVLILGITYKENSSDIRNTRVVDVYNILRSKIQNIEVYDTNANPKVCKEELGISLIKSIEKKYDVIIIAVPHSDILELDFNNLKKQNNSIVYDVKSSIDIRLSDKRL
tara:strand:+ start:1951 stop:3219 length:1269 start_codon:yes stop_codon:yes gene_type:complete